METKGMEKEIERKKEREPQKLFLAHDYYWNAFSDDVNKWNARCIVTRLHRHV